MIRKDPTSWLYPAIEPNKTGFLDVGNGHTLYYEESGNPKGKPVLFLHGGPGGGSEPRYRKFFNPESYRIIMFDQRGCGKSTPHAYLEHNTTWDLVSDIELLRKHLIVDKWQVFGGSWGSTLALVYAENHPDKVTELVLRGIFLVRKKDLSYFYQYGTSEIFPDIWEKYRDHIPENERHDFISAYHKRLTHKDPAVQLAAAKIWSGWEGVTSQLITNEEESLKRFAADTFALAFARIECHYFMNDAFFPNENYILDNAHKLKNIPTTIVHGRYDVVCPIDQAWELYKKVPHADFIVIPDAGHTIFEPGISKALVATTDKYAH